MIAAEAGTPAAANRAVTPAAATGSIGITTGSVAPVGGSMPSGAIKSH